jgi:hypothetical protein
MAESKLPRGALTAALDALRKSGLDADAVAVTVALNAVLPLIERDIRRKTAREILFLAQVDRERDARNLGPYGCVDASLNRLARGELLPDWRDLRGGTEAWPDAVTPEQEMTT